MTSSVKTALHTSSPELPHPARQYASFVTPSGIRIGYEVWGEGPPLVLIHGAFSDQNTNWKYVRSLLAPHVTGYAMSRRGRGETDATSGHDVSDEVADAIALVRHIGTPVRLLGHSYGALVALGVAAAVPSLVDKLISYEAPVPSNFDADALAPLIELGKAQDWRALATRFFGEYLSVPDADLRALQSSEDWHDILADTEASLGDLCALARHRFDPNDYSTIVMPTLLQTGGDSPRELYLTDIIASVVPAASVEVLAGQAHEAMTTSPSQYANSVIKFLNL